MFSTMLKLPWQCARTCSSVTNQGNTTNRPLLWEDDPPAEIRPRRAREGSLSPGQFRPPAAGRRGGPGMPLEFDDPDGDGNLRPINDRFAKPKGRWWPPASRVGRISLAIAALAVAGSVTTACLMLKHYLERDARFRIAGTENIQASGLTEVSRAQMLPVFGEDIGRNIFFVPLSERRRQLEQIPWIEHATVMRLLPNQIRVAVVERTPVAFTRHGAQIGLVDANGVLLNMSAATMAKRHYSFPLLTGIDPGDSAASRQERMALYLRLMSELDAGGKHNSEQISEIDLTDPEDARVLMPEQGGDILAHFGEDHFLERYERYQAHIAEWRQQYPQLASVDLRYDNQVVLQMASGKETSPDGNASANADGTANSEAAPDAKAKTEKKTPGGAAKKSKPAHGKKHAAPARRATAPGSKKRIVNGMAAASLAGKPTQRRMPGVGDSCRATGAASGGSQGG
jgi:cell division protein FtsQ